MTIADKVIHPPTHITRDDVMAICAAYEATGLVTYDPWLTYQGMNGPHRYGFGARDEQGNRWSYEGDTEGRIDRRLVRAAGPQTDAEKLHAAADAIEKGQDITNTAERAWAQQARQRAAELEI